MSKLKVPIDENIRREIVVLARRPRARRAEFTPSRPTKWRPEEVVDPETEMEFSEPSAWRFIADCAERGDDIETVRLDKPAGRTAYVMKIQLRSNRPHLYVKVELRSGRILGRSFHESDH